MTKKKKDDPLNTYVAIVLDKSGSMASTKDQTIQGYNEQVQQIRKNAKDQKTFVSLVTFSSDVYEHLWNEPAEQLQEASAEDYIPDGTTAMRDAIGYTVQKLTKTAEKDANNAFLVIIISDGAENSSQHVTKPALKELVEGRQAQGNWTFTYMGCSEDEVRRVAQETALPIANMAVWENRTVKGTKRAMHRNAENVGKYLRARSATGASATANFASDDVLCCADYTSDDDGSAGSAAPAVHSPAFVLPIAGMASVVSPAIDPDLDQIAKQAAWKPRTPVDQQVHLASRTGHEPGYFASGNSVSWES